MDKSVQDGLNDQINKELFSAYLYLAMCAHFEAENLAGFAHWMRLQAREEVDHAMRLFHYMTDRGGRVMLKDIDGPPNEFGSTLSIFEAAYEHEQQVTKSIHDLYALAAKKSDYPSQLALEWFVTEQVEEEKSAATIIDRLRMAGDNRAALLILDRDLASRAGED